MDKFLFYIGTHLRFWLSLKLLMVEQTLFISSLVVFAQEGVQVNLSFEIKSEVRTHIKSIVKKRNEL